MKFLLLAKSASNLKTATKFKEQTNPADVMNLNGGALWVDSELCNKKPP
jgi:hypothetical protein